MVILVICVRITPAKWDAEYSWLRDEGRKGSVGTSPLIVRRKERTKRERQVSLGALVKIGHADNGSERKISILMGIMLQAIGAVALLFVLGTGGGVVPFLSLGAVLSGEIIFISSLGHRGDRFRGEIR
jgi:hypothetical protein